MKRYITLLATGLVGIALLSACGSPSATTSPTKPTNLISIKETLVSKPTKYISQPNWVNPQLVYVIGWNQQVNSSGALYKSSDAGRTWTKVITPLDGRIERFFFQSKTSGMIYGVPAFTVNAVPKLYRTTNGGISWNAEPLPMSLTQTTSQFGMPSVSIIISNGKFTWLFANWNDNQFPRSLIYHSKNNGFTWTEAYQGVVGGEVISFHAPSDRTAYFVLYCADCHAGNSTGTNTLEITHDAGQTWSKIKLPFIVENQVQNLNFIDSSHAIAIVKNMMTNKVTRYRSNSGGHSWTKE